jgi:hypothetical protein
MDRQTTFLLALGMLIAAAFVVGVAGWVLFARDHASHKTLVRDGATSDATDDARQTEIVDDIHHDEAHREVAEGS